MPSPGRPVDEERVVGLRGHLGDRQRRCVGEAVRGADHELLEGVLRVEARGGVGAGARAASAVRGRGAAVDRDRAPTGRGPPRPRSRARRRGGRPPTPRPRADPRARACRRRARRSAAARARGRRFARRRVRATRPGSAPRRDRARWSRRATSSGWRLVRRAEGGRRRVPGGREYSNGACARRRDSAHLAGKTGARYTRRSGHEAHLSAQEAQAREGARLSCAHADARRTG